MKERRAVVKWLDAISPSDACSLHSTNLIKNCSARTAVLRFAEQGCRCLQGQEQLGRHIQALQKTDAKLAPQKKTAR